VQNRASIVENSVGQKEGRRGIHLFAKRYGMVDVTVALRMRKEARWKSRLFHVEHREGIQCLTECSAGWKIRSGRRLNSRMFHVERRSRPRDNSGLAPMLS
jgi:hypothetical protein